MPAIASLEDSKAAQKGFLEAKDLNELKAAQGITICDSIPHSEFRIPHLEDPGAIKRGRRRVRSENILEIAILQATSNASVIGSSNTKPLFGKEGQGEILLA